MGIWWIISLLRTLDLLQIPPYKPNMDYDHNEIGSLGFPKYPRLGVEYPALGIRSEENNLAKAIGFYVDNFLRSENGKELIEYLTANGFRKNVVSKTIFGGHSVSFHELTRWFAFRANLTTKRKAINALKRYWIASEHEKLLTLWVTGIDVAEKKYLGSGYWIFPLDAMPISTDREKFRTDFADIPFEYPKAAIVKKVKIKKKHSDISAADRRNWAKTTNDLVLYSRLLNLLKPIRCVPYMQSAYSLDSPADGLFGGGGRLFTRYPMNDFSYDLSKEAIKDLKNLYLSFNRRTEQEKKLIMTALRKFATAKQHQEIENRFIDLCVALEILFLNDNKTHQQLSLSFRLHGTLLLGGSLIERQQNEKKFHEIYTHRSGAAHAGQIKKTGKHSKSKSTSPSIVFEDFEEAGRISLTKIVYNGIPDWAALRISPPK